MSQKIDIRERRFNGVDYDTLHPETNINMVLDSSNNSVGGVNGALYGDGNGNIVGAAISNLNLLDNPWFTVNQRGVVTTSVNEAFISDRWHIYHGAGVVNADKTITFTVTQDGAGIFQISPYRSDIVGKIVTLSIMYDNGSVESGTITVAASGYRAVTLSSGISLSVDTRNSREQFAINVPNGTTVTLRAVKLELGTVSTLANDVAPNYTTELLKCRRYFKRILADNIGLGIAASTSLFDVFVPNDVPMLSASPTHASSGTLSLYDTTGTITGIAIVRNADNANLTIRFNATGLTTGAISRLNISNGGYIDISADL